MKRPTSKIEGDRKNDYPFSVVQLQPDVNKLGCVRVEPKPG